MSSPALTQSDFGDKFAAIQSRITPAALDLINRSETLKAAIRRYENDGRTRAVDLDDDTTPNAATYQPPGEGDGTDGYITFGVDTLRNSIDIVHVLSHELGHHAVEGLGDLITNARNSAYAKGDFEGLEKSCHLSEGYALLKSAKVAEEIVNSGVTGSDARKLTAWWESERYAAYKDSAASLSWTRDAMDASLAYLLGDHNRWKTTSNTKESYLQYCRNEATSILESGSGSVAPSPAAIETGTTFNPGGSSQTFINDGRGNISITSYDPSGMPAGYVWKHTDGSRGSALFKPDGSTSTTVIKSDGTYKRYANDGKGNVVVIDYNRDGQQTGYTWWRADGSRGSEVSDGAGGRTGTVMRSDGSYANYSDDGHGNSSRTLYNAEGGFVSNEWRRDDGSAGGISRGIDGSTTVFSTDGRGGGTQTTYRPDGVVHQTVVDAAGVRTVLDDGEGTRIETQWGANGVGIVANTVVRYNADGSGTSTTTDADGRVTEKHFARGELGPWTAPPTPDDRPWFPPKDGKIEPIWPDDPWVPSDPPTGPHGGPDDAPFPKPPETPQKDPVPPSGDGGQVDPGTAGSFAGATAAAPRRDPLVLDLDDDGIETVGVNTANPLMFDIAATGIKQSVGWVKRDDGFLVLDRNGNGSIDSGAELFGDATTLANGQKAVDGFAALAEFDVNHDGKIDTADVRFADLRVWRDLNQDGVSQAGELATLGSLGIAALNVGNTSHSTVLSNGNRIADVGTYVKTTGELGGLGETAQTADVDLAVDTFRSQFTDHLDTSSVASLPDMQGAGQVRSLREAATLNSALATLLGQFAVATDRATQQGLIDGILKQWSNTSTMAATFTGAYAGHALTVNVQGIAAGSATYQAWADRLTILERFNGRTFNAVPAGTAAMTVDLWTTSQALLQQSYDHLKASVYQSLALQTGLRPYLDKIGLTVTATGVKLDFSALRTEFDARFAVDQASALADLVDFSLGTRQRLKDSGWDSTREIIRLLDQMSITPAIQASLVSAGILVDGAANWNAGGTGADDLMVGHGGNETFSGGDGQDTLYGGAGNDMLYGGTGNDVLDGGAGNDSLYGKAGDDTLDGGTGNDYLVGGAGNNTYVFRRGDGYDTLSNYDLTPGRTDTLELDGLNAADIRLDQWGTDLAILIKGSWEWMKLQFFFESDTYKIDAVQFADGTTWNRATLLAQEVNLVGGSGNDSLNARNGGPNALYGNDGNDNLNGGNATDRVFGGAGNDSLYGKAGDDTLDGGTGNDYLVGGAGNNTYVFRRGDGYDTLSNYDLTPGRTDTLELDGLNAADIRLDQWGTDLAILIKGSWEWMKLQFFFESDTYKIDAVQFADGTTWNRATLLAQEVNLVGGSGNDSLTARNGGPNALYGNDGNDNLNGGNATDRVFGGAGDDWLYGNAGDDSLDGGAGTDNLYGGAGKDTYLFNRGTGFDWIRTGSSTSGTDDVIRLGSDIAPEQIELRRYVNNLDVILNKADGSTERQVVVDYFAGYAIKAIEFADGTLWNQTEISNRFVQYGWDSNDTLTALDGINNRVRALGGNDNVNGGNGADLIDGGLGNDTLYGNAGNDTLDGGAGDDVLQGGVGDDSYAFNRGGGFDWIRSDNAANTGGDAVRLAAGITADDVELRRYGNNLDVILKRPDGADPGIHYAGNTTDRIVVEGYFSGSKINRIDFADGNVWNQAAIEARFVHYGGSGNDTLTAADGINNRVSALAGNDTLNGGNGNDSLDGGSGDDRLYGGAGNDVLIGGTGNNLLDGGTGTDEASYASATAGVGVSLANTATQITGGAGTDTLVGIENLTGSQFNDTLTGSGLANVLDGGAGNDTLSGGLGNDTYRFARGGGADLVIDSDATAGNTDLAQFAAGIAADQIWFSHLGNDLQVSLIGTPDTLTIQNWYAGAASHVEQFQTADNKLLLDSKVEALVQAMAAFAPPAAGQTSLPPAYLDALAPVLAANWQ